MPVLVFYLFFFNDTATTEIYTLSLHDALPICLVRRAVGVGGQLGQRGRVDGHPDAPALDRDLALRGAVGRSEEHTSELQSRQYLVCRLLLEKKQYSSWSTRSRHEALTRAHNSL